MSERILKFEGKRPDSAFQMRFKINEEFYSASDIRQAISDCFPQGDIPFTGLDYIQNSEDVDEARRLTQKTDVPREKILEERIPKAESLPTNTRIHIFEKQRYLEDGGRYKRQYGMMLEASDCGYVVNCVW